MARAARYGHLAVGIGSALAHRQTEDQRAKYRADDAGQIELRALSMRQSIADHPSNEAAEGACQERGPWAERVPRRSTTPPAIIAITMPMSGHMRYVIELSCS